MSHRVASTAQKNKLKASDFDKGVTPLSLSSDEWLFTQNTIVASVMTEPGTSLIKPETSKFVNSHGDTWTNESLLANAPSYYGAWNFLNHVDDPNKSIGFIPDHALRRVNIFQRS